MHALGAMASTRPPQLEGELSSKEGGDVMCRKYCSVNSNRVQILGKIRLDWFVISLNLEIGFLRVKSGFLKGQVSPSI